MPGRDGSGPAGNGKLSGRKMGLCQNGTARRGSPEGFKYGRRGGLFQRRGFRGGYGVQMDTSDQRGSEIDNMGINTVMSPQQITDIAVTLQSLQGLIAEIKPLISEIAKATRPLKTDGAF